MNNNLWLKDLNLINFLTTVGVNVRLNTMLSRERCAFTLLLFIYLLISFPASAHAWSPIKASRSQSSHTNSYKRMISSIYITITNVPSKSEVQINGEIF